MKRFFALLLLSTFGVGCGPDLKKDQCASDANCGGSLQCVQGTCVEPDFNNENNTTGNNTVGNNQNNTVGNNQNNTVGNNQNNTTGTNNPPNNTTGNNVTAGACLETDRDVISFGGVSTSGEASRPFSMRNCSRDVDLRLDRVTVCEQTDNGCVDTGVFSIDAGNQTPPTGGGSLSTTPGGSFDWALLFSPDEVREFVGTLTIESNDPAGPVREITVAGQGVDSACPNARAGGRVDSAVPYSTDLTTIPLKTVELSANGSMPIDGDIDRYEWTIIERPNNSTARLTPSDNVAEPSLFLDLAGTYRIELRVFDDGVASCGARAIVTINATPDEAIHVQLVWDTPTDPDQTDASGTDMDLHFLHPSGAWESEPWDIFWRNPSADWADTPNSAQDDPSLDIDDTDGAGPENVNYDAPENRNYEIGVHYYDEKGFGNSYATIRVYLSGTLAYEYRDLFLTEGDFWHAATVNYTSQTVVGVDTVTAGFPMP